jgi:RNA-directed DNA polymerase
VVSFDRIDHGLLMKAVRTHIGDNWILLYIERWLTAPFELEDGTRLPRERGTPQEGVVSPVLMNLFMHYVFDCWMKRTWPHCPFARYADDAVIHCRNLKQAENVMQSIASRLTECGLEMHPEKSAIVYCKNSNRAQSWPQVQFTFLGFTFRPRAARNSRNQLFTGFLPGASVDALKRMRQTVRRWKLHGQTPATLAELAQQYNPMIRGWFNYYGAFYRTAMQQLFRYIDRKLEQWARRKYKTLARRKRRSAEWLGKMKDVFPQLFFHWRFRGGLGG